MNDLPEGVISLRKIFANDRFLFPKMINKIHSEIDVNKDLKLISQWGYRGKMLFNPNPARQTMQMCFSYNVIMFLSSL